MEDIKVRIQKLLDLSSSPNENEAKEALLKVQKLLVKYNLTMKDFSHRQEEVKEIKKGLRVRWWHNGISAILARNFRCKVYNKVTKIGKTIVFVGKESDVEVCSATFDYIKEATNYNCKQYISKRRLRKKENIKLAKDSYITGFIEGLNYALECQKNSNEWGLVLSTPIEVEDFYNKIQFYKDPSDQEKDSNKKSDAKLDPGAFYSGCIDGKKFAPGVNQGYIE